MRIDQLKQQVEAKYETEDRHVEMDDYAGQMTIAFCAAGDWVSEDCEANPSCPDDWL